MFARDCRHASKTKLFLNKRFRPGWRGRGEGGRERLKSRRRATLVVKNIFINESVDVR